MTFRRYSPARVVDKIDLYEPSPDDVVAGVIVGVVTAVEDVATLMVKVYGRRGSVQGGPGSARSGCTGRSTTGRKC